MNSQFSLNQEQNYQKKFHFPHSMPKNYLLDMDVFSQSKIPPALLFKQHFNEQEIDKIRTDPTYYIQNKDYIENFKKFKKHDLVSLLKEEEKIERRKIKKLAKRRKSYDQTENRLEINPKNINKYIKN